MERLIPILPISTGSITKKTPGWLSDVVCPSLTRK
jgi:hypothetical protein